MLRPERPALEPQGETLSLRDELIAYAQSNRRVCPAPTRWNRLWHLLATNEQHAARTEPPRPLILAAWHHTTPLDKIDRLRLQIVWAEEQGMLGQIGQFLRGLEEAEWSHLDDF